MDLRRQGLLAGAIRGQAAGIQRIGFGPLPPALTPVAPPFGIGQTHSPFVVVSQLDQQPFITAGGFHDEMQPGSGGLVLLVLQDRGKLGDPGGGIRPAAQRAGFLGLRFSYSGVESVFGNINPDIQFGTHGVLLLV